MNRNIWGSVVSVASAAVESVRRHAGWQLPPEHDHRPPSPPLSVAPAATLATPTPLPSYIPPLDPEDTTSVPAIHPAPQSPASPRRRARRALTPEPRYAAPRDAFDFNSWVGMAPPAPTAAEALPPSVAASLVVAAVDVTLVADGSYRNSNGSSRRNFAGPMGTAFIAHKHRTSTTRVFCRAIPPDVQNSSMLAEALSLDYALEDALNDGAKSIHAILDCRTIRQIALGRDSANNSDKLGRGFSDVMARIIDRLRSFDEVFISHLNSHKRLLAENSFVDYLASLACENPTFALNEVVHSGNVASCISSMHALRRPRNTELPLSIPFLGSAAPCASCKCPSHADSTCFLHHSEYFPARSTFCKVQPSRPLAFEAQLHNIADIDWDNAPACISYPAYTKLSTMCFSALRREDLFRDGTHAISQFALHYRIINGHISRRKLKERRALEADPLNSQHERLARDARTAARLARDTNYRDAMKVLDRQLPIGPNHPAARAQLPLLYPEQVVEASIPPSVPHARRLFDRTAIWKYIKSRSATSSPGISGFGFSFLQLFGRLTVEHETDQDEDPHWTVFVALVEDLACGSLPWLRQWATSLKGALFNKSPDPSNIKIRNLGIAETIVRVASFMVIQEALPAARAAGLITPLDLGIGVPGGPEKYVKIARVAAELGCTILSCDLEKAFNSVLRADVWEAVQHVKCPLLSAWFCFFYSEKPSVYFNADPSLPFSMVNTVQYTQHEGLGQGDPASQLYMNITLAHILLQHRERHPDVLRASIHDDLMFICKARGGGALPVWAADLQATLLAHNLKLNVSKTIVYSSSPFDFDQATVPFSLTHEGFHVCQTAVGSHEFCMADARIQVRKVQNAEVLFTRLHTALKQTDTKGRGIIFVDLLRLCFRSRFSWCMRTLTPAPAYTVAQAADEAMSRLFKLVLPFIPPTPLPHEWLHLHRMHAIKVALPVVRGGVGLRPWLSLLHVAHFSSWVEAGPRILKALEFLECDMPPECARHIGESVAHCSWRVTPKDPHYWRLDPRRCRTKTQHELTELLDDADIEEGSSLSHDPAVNAQFIGSCTAPMCLPFNSAAIPRHVLHHFDDETFRYALAWHTLCPIFKVFQCPCNTASTDPLGLHFVYCNRLNGKNLLHNSVRDCFDGATRRLANDAPMHNVYFQKTDSAAKSSTYIHDWYPLKPTAPAIMDRASKKHAPSLSPDLIVAFKDAPHRPYFVDFVAASPSAQRGTSYSEAAQAAHTKKLSHYSSHHTYPMDVFYPLPFERSGYLHPSFDDFIRLYVQSAIPDYTPRHVLKVYFAVAYAITFTTASILNAAGSLLSPDCIRSCASLRARPVPAFWAPDIPLHPFGDRRLDRRLIYSPDISNSRSDHDGTTPSSLPSRATHGACLTSLRAHVPLTDGCPVEATAGSE